MNPYTGQWSTADGDDPRDQLHAEWKGVLAEIRNARPDRARLFVGRALGVPGLTLPPEMQQHCGIDREFLLDRRDLHHFETAWNRRMEQWNAVLSTPSRECFFDTYGADARPEAIRHFVDDIDRQILRQTEAKYPLLSQLSANRQFLVSGGVGSGKTWLALELARRWVADNRQKVLIIGYNLAFVAQMSEWVERLKRRNKLAPGDITVVSWEGLAADLLQKANLPYDPPSDLAERTLFFESLLPSTLRALAHAGSIQPGYDALIVDEAQDHDTTAPEGDGTPTECGWWPVYWALLRRGAQSRIGIFFDDAQRPSFRSGRFEVPTLLRQPGFAPVRIHLETTLRYSLPIFRYLKSLDTPAVASLRAGLQQSGPLPLGPEVETHAVAAGDEASCVEGIVSRWLEQGWARAEQILVLSRRGVLARSCLSDCRTLAGIPLHDGLQPPRDAIGYGSVNRAKGLDQLAVILVDFPPWPDQDAGDQVSFFMGASRARQLLAVVATGGSRSPCESISGE